MLKKRDRDHCQGIEPAVMACAKDPNAVNG